MNDFGVKNLLKRFGSEIVLCEQDKNEKIHGVIQPLLYKNKMYLGGTATPVGMRDEGRFLMIGEIPKKVTDWGKVLVSAGKDKYSVKRAEVISCRGCDLYIWAVLTPCKEDLEDDYEEYDRCA